jgi:hypothetical protein
MFDFRESQEAQLKNKIFVGIVEENKDPLRKGRLKIRVQSIFDDSNSIPTANIPWAHPFKSLDGKEFRTPEIGKIVNVVFPTGNIYYLEYIYAENYNINLQNKLKGLSDDEYTKFTALLFDHRTQIYSDEEKLMLDFLNNQIEINKGGIMLHLKDNDQVVKVGHRSASQSAILGDHWLEWFDEFMNILAVPTNLTGNLGAPILRPALDLTIKKYFALRKSFASTHVKLVDNAKCYNDGFKRESSPTVDDLTKINTDPILSSPEVPVTVKELITENRTKDAEETLINEPNKDDKEPVGAPAGEMGEDFIVYGDLTIDMPAGSVEYVNGSPTDISAIYTYDCVQGYGWTCTINNNLNLPPIVVDFNSPIITEDEVLTILKKQMFLNGGDFKPTEYMKIDEQNYVYGPVPTDTSTSESSETEAGANDVTEANEGIIVYGGASYAIPAWMEEQWKAAGLSTTKRKVIFEGQGGRSVNSIKKAYPDINFVALAAFSGGGPQIWDYVGDEQFKFIGLIDPSTKDQHIPLVKKFWKGRTILYFNYNNWSGAASSNTGITRRILKKIFEGKNSDFVINLPSIIPTETNHKEIPIEFFKRYKSQLEG